ncbi:Protein CBG09666 [Caenorhabditis briggsae]|uniref:Protein CBG09666 n=1 Tax=Caenorhabditis briggsae TaxID=6238 RepID=A8X8I7_CAEBR|nr:Protein CBG09666 [Caenorhabditis briggsae]CAP28948.2 Protein CBG09666 [Caenorhabditis briggsae]
MMSAEETMEALREFAPQADNMTQYLTSNVETSQPLPFDVDHGFAEYIKANCYDKRRSVVKNSVKEVESDELKQQISAHGEMIEKIKSDPELNSNYRFDAIYNEEKMRQICRVLAQRTMISQGRIVEISTCGEDRNIKVPESILDYQTIYFPPEKRIQIMKNITFNKKDVIPVYSDIAGETVESISIPNSLLFDYTDVNYFNQTAEHNLARAVKMAAEDKNTIKCSCCSSDPDKKVIRCYENRNCPCFIMNEKLQKFQKPTNGNSPAKFTSFEPIHFTSTDRHFYQHMGFACSELCGCEAKCTNNVLMIPNKRLFPVEMFRSNEKLGFGVRSNVLIPAGTPVTEFVGEIIGEQIHMENVNWNNIEYAYQVTYGEDDVMKQLVDQATFSKNYKSLIKDLYASISYYLDPTVCGNYARMASHSCAANMELVRVFQKSLSPAHIHLVMVAVTDIFPGTPITIDYGNDYATRLENKCQCGTFACLNGPESREMKNASHAEFGDSQTVRTNADTLYREINVVNNTEYSLCRLGCTHPEFETLSLPEFTFGQSAYREIVDNQTSAKSEEVQKNIVKEVRFLCLDHQDEGFTGRVNMLFEKDVEESNHIHYVELISRDEGDDEEVILHHSWCYNSNCYINFNNTFLVDFRLRVSAFNGNGAVGRRLSKWYNARNLLSVSNDLSLKSVEWKDDKAVARLSPDSNSGIPACSYEIQYKNALSSEYTTVKFYLDHTNELLVRGLEFNQNYTVTYISDLIGELVSVDVSVPACSLMVTDVTMCAPPSVSSLHSRWNTSSGENDLEIDWNYFWVLDANTNRIDRSIRTSHFHITVHPLITPNNPNCEKYEPIRRDVDNLQRHVSFRISDAKCNYEVEAVVFDTKRRKSETKKMKIVRINEPSYMALLPATDVQTTIGLVVLLTCAIIFFTLIILIILLKKRNQSRRRRRGETVCYAYVDEPSRKIVGVRQPGARFLPVENMNRDVEAGLAQRTVGCNIQNGPKVNMFQVLPQPPYGDSTSDHHYDYISEYQVESEMSDEVFEEDICISTPNTPYRIMDSPSFCLMAPIAPFEEFDDLPAYAFQTFRFGKPYERPGNPYCLMTTAMDVSRGNCFSLKYPRDYSEPTRRALRRELEILRILPLHPNIVHFNGVVIGRWENIPYQITGILMEECLGGTLHDYINSAGFVLRRQGMRTPDDVCLPIANESPNQSSGYNSFTSKGRQTPEQKTNQDKNSCQIVSSKFIGFAEQISSALEHLHFVRIIHSRVSSMSIFLSCDFTDPLEMPSEQIVKLGDFSNAFPNSNDASVLDPMLQPPEVMMGKKFETKGDIWQMGMCLVEMCTLGTPFAMQKHIPMSGVSEFDKLPSTRFIRDTAKKCLLKPRSRPEAANLRVNISNYTG